MSFVSSPACVCHCGRCPDEDLTPPEEWPSDHIPWAWFYPDRFESTWPAERICAVCPSQDECLTEALRLNERKGVWGGMARLERIELRKQIKEEHGSEVLKDREALLQLVHSKVVSGEIARRSAVSELRRWEADE